MHTLRIRRPRSKRFIDHTGERIGTLTAVSFAGFQGRFPKWRCRCDCGKIRTIFNRDFNRPGRTKFAVVFLRPANHIFTIYG